MSSLPYLILSLVSGLISLADKFLGWLHDKKLADSAMTEQKYADLKKQVDAAHDAAMARNTLERSIISNPSILRDDDGFKRPD